MRATVKDVMTMTASAAILEANTCRSSRSAKTYDKQLSLARRPASSGRLPKEVFAASASTIVTANVTR